MPVSFARRGAWWWARGTIRGPGGKSLAVYESTGLETNKYTRAAVEAAWETRRQELAEGLIFGPRAVVSWRHAAASYLNHQPRSAATTFYVDRLTAHFGDTKLGQIDQAAMDKAVAGIVGESAAPATKRRGVIGPATAVLMHAHARQWCDLPRFNKPKVPRARTAWLAPRDALNLEACAAPHLRPLIRFLLCTGARLSEALDLQWGDVDLPAATVRLHQKGDRIRIAKLPPAAVTTLANLPNANAREGHVFRRDDGKPYVSRGRQSGGQIDTAWATACQRAGVAGNWREQRRVSAWTPRTARGGTRYGGEAGIRKTKTTIAHRFVPDLTPHDLRHTYATWFYALTKDPFRLKEEGGWETLAMVERYAHLMPSELAGDVSLVWGASHPAIGALPMPRLTALRAANADT